MVRGIAGRGIFAAVRDDGLATQAVMPVGHDHVEAHADADAGVRHVEGGEPVIRQMDVDEVDDVVAEEAVAHVAERAADEEAESELAALEFAQERLTNLNPLDKSMKHTSR